ncbi:PDZ domain [Trinorchestia longiramus]|nr:PDZ domain [Trinorchestia longiramus]
MVVYREEGGTAGGKEEDLYEMISVQLTKKQGKGLGLSIVGRKNGPGVFISDLVDGGVAQSDGRLMQGDQILEVNKTDVRNATQEQAAAVLKCAPGTVDIRLGRLKPGKRVQRDTTWPVMVDQTPSPPPLDSPPLPPSLPHPSKSRTVIPVSGASISQQIPLISPQQLPPSLAPQQFSMATPQPLPLVPPQQLPPSLPAQQLPLVSPQQPQSPGIREIILERGDDGLGFSIVGGFGSNLGDLPIYVKSVFERGSAAREGTLRRGDQILSVNGTSLRGLTHASAVTVLKEAKGTVKMIILPSK